MFFLICRRQHGAVGTFHRLPVSPAALLRLRLRLRVELRLGLRLRLRCAICARLRRGLGGGCRARLGLRLSLRSGRRSWTRRGGLLWRQDGCRRAPFAEAWTPYEVGRFQMAELDKFLHFGVGKGTVLLAVPRDEPLSVGRLRGHGCLGSVAARVPVRRGRRCCWIHYLTLLVGRTEFVNSDPFPIAPQLQNAASGASATLHLACMEREKAGLRGAGNRALRPQRRSLLGSSGTAIRRPTAKELHATRTIRTPERWPSSARFRSSSRTLQSGI